MPHVRRSYIAGTLIVWLAILIGAALALRDTPYIARMLIVLSPGIVWFLVVVPRVLLRDRQAPATHVLSGRDSLEED